MSFQLGLLGAGSSGLEDGFDQLNMGPLMIRIGTRLIRRNPQNSIGNHKGPYIRVSVPGCSEWAIPEPSKAERTLWLYTVS